LALAVPVLYLLRLFVPVPGRVCGHPTIQLKKYKYQFKTLKLEESSLVFHEINNTRIKEKNTHERRNKGEVLEKKEKKFRVSDTELSFYFVFFYSLRLSYNCENSMIVYSLLSGEK
jgi:hypothetical protein